MKKAFTLAEVLITIGIIGVVIAMTLPSLVTKYQKQQFAALLKKAYSTFSQALILSQEFNGPSDTWLTLEPSSTYEENLNYFKLYWEPYLKVLQVCETMEDCGYKIHNYASVSDLKNYSYFGQYTNVPGFIYGDGTYAYIRPYNKNSTADNPKKVQLLSIDLNGPKNPNIIGIDVFQFEIDTSRGIIAGFGSFLYGRDASFCTKEKVKKSNDYARSCSIKVMSDGWEFKSDYPWYR